MAYPLAKWHHLGWELISCPCQLLHSVNVQKRLKRGTGKLSVVRGTMHIQMTAHTLLYQPNDWAQHRLSVGETLWFLYHGCEISRTWSARTWTAISNFNWVSSAGLRQSHLWRNTSRIRTQYLFLTKITSRRSFESSQGHSVRGKECWIFDVNLYAFDYKNITICNSSSKLSIAVIRWRVVYVIGELNFFLKEQGWQRFKAPVNRA